MNSRDAAKLCFGDPGFFDFLQPLIKNPIGTILDVVSPVHAFQSVQQGLYGLAPQRVTQAIAPVLKSLPIVGSVFQAVDSNIAATINDISDTSDEGDDGTGANSDDADSGY